MIRRTVTASIMNDPLPDRLERAEALRLILPTPRAEIPLSDWMTDERETGVLTSGLAHRL